VRTRIVSTGDDVVAEADGLCGPCAVRAPAATMALERTCWLVATDLVRWDGEQALAFAIAKTLFFTRDRQLDQARMWALIARAVEAVLAPRGDAALH
jgi:hypothetical protein